MTRFHSEDYMSFLQSATPENLKHYNKQMLKCLFYFYKIKKMHFLVNVGEDCPVFDGLYEFCQLSSGGSLCKQLFNLSHFFRLF